MWVVWGGGGVFIAASAAHCSPFSGCIFGADCSDYSSPFKKLGMLDTAVNNSLRTKE